MIVDSAVYRNGKRVPVEGAKEDFLALKAACEHDADFVWVGLHEPTKAEMDAVAGEFGLHQLAVEDSLHAHQRPKLEFYESSPTRGETVFLVLKTLWYVDEQDAVETGQVSVFFGRDFVVSVRQGAGIELHSLRRDLERHGKVLGHGPAAVAYAICDRVVDGYELVIDELQTDVGEVEESVFSPERTQDAHRIYVLKRELAEMRRAVTPLREPIARFAAGDVPHVHEDARPFYRDVLDHVVRVAEGVDSLDNLLATAFQAYLARVSVQQNEDMRKISAWVAIGAALTVIAGIYGMNFRNMPELGWHYGYYLCLLLMVVVSGVLYRFFKKNRWL